MAPRTLLQAFHWYYPGEGRLWRDIEEKAVSLAEIGITDVWLPPVYKGSAGGFSVGYDVYDLFDLGEFDQKGSVATKYGDRAALERAARALEANGIGVIYDVVLNHKMGADETERVRVHRVNQDNRQEIDPETFEATVHTRFTFPGRQGRYSEFIWDAKCFTGVDYIEDPDENGVFKLVNDHDEGWGVEVGAEFGNFDYLMGSDIEFRNKAVYEELKYWGRWLMGELPCAGSRLDAVKHIPAWFFRDWIGHMRENAGKDLFVVAEYWLPDLDALRTYLDLVDRQLMLFDVTLHYHFYDASKAGADYDLRTLFDGTLVGAMPEHAVTLVANHDTQPLQSLEAPVEPWFKPLAYALILLREQGVPCVFHPDLYGATYTDKGGDGQDHTIDMPAIACLPRLVEARKRFAHGSQTDVFDEPHCIAFIRHGTSEAPGCVVVMTNAGETAKAIDLGPEMGGIAFRDFLEHRDDEVSTDEAGRASFPVNGGSVSVWVRADALT
jgi:alpha-amylase